jgi:hypothetical protein
VLSAEVINLRAEQGEATDIAPLDLIVRGISADSLQ